MSWLCRLGLHRWRRVLRFEEWVFPMTGVRLRMGDGWMPKGKQCRRCGARER